MDRKILYLLERCASTIEEVTFVHISGHLYNLSNLEVDKMARQELEKEYPEKIPKKSLQSNKSKKSQQSREMPMKKKKNLMDEEHADANVNQIHHLTKSDAL